MKKKILNKLSSFVFFYKFLKNKIFLGLGLNILVGLLDGLGLFLFIPLLQMINNPDNEVVDKSYFQETLESIGFLINFNNVMILMLFVFVLKGLMKFLSLSYQVNLFQIFIKKIRLDTFNSFHDLNFKHFITQDIGHIQNSFTSC